MPSPVGHSLAAVVVLGIDSLSGRRARRPKGRRAERRALVGRLLFIALAIFAANAPDLDFAPGLIAGDADRFHHGPTHSLAAALVFGLAVFLVARVVSPRSALRVGGILFLAYVSHLLLDMMSIDTRPPRGVPFFWPLTSEHFAFPIELFRDIKRDGAAGNFFSSLLVKYNAYSVLREFVVMGTLLAVGRLGVFLRDGRRSWSRNRRVLERAHDRVA
jgi:inner membrane protein